MYKTYSINEINCIHNAYKKTCVINNNPVFFNNWHDFMLLLDWINKYKFEKIAFIINNN